MSDRPGSLLSSFSAHHHSHLSPLIEHSLFSIHIRLSLAGNWSRSPPEPSKEEVQLQCTSGDATPTIYFLYLVYVERRRPRAPPASG